MLPGEAGAYSYFLMDLLTYMLNINIHTPFWERNPPYNKRAVGDSVLSHWWPPLSTVWERTVSVVVLRDDCTVLENPDANVCVKEKPAAAIDLLGH